MRKGKTFIICGPSGVGKGTVVARPAAHPGPAPWPCPRKSWAFHTGCQRTVRVPGTDPPRSTSQTLDIEIQGAEQVKRKRPETVRIYVAPPSWAELERRLIGHRVITAVVGVQQALIEVCQPDDVTGQDADLAKSHRFLPRMALKVWIKASLLVDDIDKEYQRVVSLGAAVIEPPAARPWGAVNMSFADPDGHEQVHPTVLLLLMEGAQIIREQLPGGVVVLPHPEDPVAVAVVHGQI